MSKANKVVDAVINAVEPKFEALDTTVVQVRSVLNFMYTLGYTLDPQGKTGRFFTEVKDLQGNRFLSFATAAKFHNLREEEWVISPETGEAHPEGITLRRGFSPLGVRLAVASKLVKEVKLSVARTGQVITQDVMIKPQNEAVLRLVEPA